MTTKITSSPTFTPTGPAPTASSSTPPAPPEVAEKTPQGVIEDGWVDASDDSPGTFEWLGKQADRAIEDASNGIDEFTEQAHTTVAELLANAGSDLGPGAQLDPGGRQAQRGQSPARMAQEVVEELLWVNDMSSAEVIEAGWETIGMPADRRAELAEAFDARAGRAREMISERVDTFTSSARELAPQVIDAVGGASKKAIAHSISPLFGELILDGMENPDGVVGIARDIAHFGLDSMSIAARCADLVLPDEHALLELSKEGGRGLQELGVRLDGALEESFDGLLGVAIGSAGASLIATGQALEFAGRVPELLDDFIANEDDLHASIEAFDAVKLASRIKEVGPNQKVGYSLKLSGDKGSRGGDLRLDLTANRTAEGKVKVKVDVGFMAKYGLGGAADKGGASAAAKLDSGSVVEFEFGEDAAIDVFTQLFQSKLVGGPDVELGGLYDSFEYKKVARSAKGGVSIDASADGVNASFGGGLGVGYGAIQEKGELKAIVSTENAAELGASVGAGGVEVFLPDKGRGFADVVEAVQERGGAAALDALDDHSISVIDRVVGMDSKVSVKVDAKNSTELKLSMSGGLEAITGQSEANVVIGKNTVKITRKVTIDDPAKFAAAIGMSVEELREALTDPDADVQELMHYIASDEMRSSMKKEVNIDLIVKDKVGVETSPFSSTVHLSETIPLYKSKDGEQQDVGVKNASGALRRAKDTLASELRPRQGARSVPQQTNISAFLGGFRV